MHLQIFFNFAKNVPDIIWLVKDEKEQWYLIVSVYPYIFEFIVYLLSDVDFFPPVTIDTIANNICPYFSQQLP